MRIKYKDVRLKQKHRWYVLTAPAITDYELWLSSAHMSKMAAIREFILEVENECKSRLAY